ncbi:hypothetical protein [Actinoplanes auranticolor]|uniref:Uncharacterized protein n=1 Tax=Actinoplanes auranticolor TaxID=47988 RepID=A0A919SE03_9ACTN|nr:hypothetical protein [Actinoplanes auranticolor]GIM69994.1 hypothetical protein Aau02nite_38920 [Actinoplanes auranticolor]
MAARRYRYSVGNEEDPGDPWGRSELLIEPDGAVSLQHVFPGPLAARAWTGRVRPAALDALRDSLERAGFPAGPAAPPAAGSGLRRLTVETRDGSASVVLPWHLPASAPSGYAETFDVLDGVIRQVTGSAVAYPSTQSDIVSDIAEAPAGDPLI